MKCTSSLKNTFKTRRNTHKKLVDQEKIAPKNYFRASYSAWLNNNWVPTPPNEGRKSLHYFYAEIGKRKIYPTAKPQQQIFVWHWYAVWIRFFWQMTCDKRPRWIRCSLNWGISHHSINTLSDQPTSRCNLRILFNSLFYSLFHSLKKMTEF